MKVIATAKIIAARIRFRERPPMALLAVMAPLIGCYIETASTHGRTAGGPRRDAFPTRRYAAAFVS
jgi:hypothetical protein